jgi:L-lysine 6-transaminase
VIAEDNLVENAEHMGKYLLGNLEEIQNEFPNLVSQARGLGLMCSFNLPDTETRNNFLDGLSKEQVLMLGCGPKSVRFRPPLNVTKDALDLGFEKIKTVLNKMS